MTTTPPTTPPAAPTLTPGAGDCTDVTRDGTLIGHIIRRNRSWYWKGAGDTKWCPTPERTRKAALRCVETCADVRAAFAAHDAARTARLDVHHQQILDEGYTPADVADVTPGRMVRYRTGRGYWSEPVLATRVQVFANGGAALTHTHLEGFVVPAYCGLLTREGSRQVMVRDRTAQADQQWQRWLAETDDSPDACAARAIPPGWTPAPWGDVAEGDTIRHPARIRHDRVYEWSQPFTIVSFVRKPDSGGVTYTYTYTDFEGDEWRDASHLMAPLAAYGVLRPPASA